MRIRPAVEYVCTQIKQDSSNNTKYNTDCKSSHRIVSHMRHGLYSCLSGDDHDVVVSIVRMSCYSNQQTNSCKTKHQSVEISAIGSAESCNIARSVCTAGEDTSSNDTIGKTDNDNITKSASLAENAGAGTELAAEYQTNNNSKAENDDSRSVSDELLGNSSCEDIVNNENLQQITDHTNDTADDKDVGLVELN